MVVSAATSVTAPRGQPLDMNLSRQTSGNQPSVVGSASSGKQMQCRVDFLDDQHFVFRLPPKTLGQTLFDQVCEHLGLLETDYFGLEYGDTDGNKYWLDLEKPIGRQLAYKAPSANVLHVHFGVKFYTPDPVQLEEEITRYLFVLQIRKDLASGLMPCQDSTAALLAAYVVQAEEGDYSADNYRDYTYLLKYKFLPQQDVTFLSEVRNSHLQLVGQSPAEADLNFLETARRCEMYGIKLHAANDHENVALNLAVAHMGIVVFQNTQKINIFSWAKIRKLSFKRKRFLIKLHSEPGYGFYKDTVEFFFDSRNACKNFWKKCIEHHGFFRCPVVQTLPRSKTKIFPAGSSFRFSGRTQKQVLEFARDNYGKRPSFHRGTGSSRIRSSQSCGASLAATPLLPMARARDSRYNTTGGTRSRRSQQGENGALARSRSEPMEVTEVMNPDRSSDSGSRTLERGHRVDASQEMPLSSNEHVPGDYQQQTSIMRTERYEEYRTAGANGHHVQEVVSVTVEGEGVVPSMMTTMRRRLSRDSAVHVYDHEDLEVGGIVEEDMRQQQSPPGSQGDGVAGGGDGDGAINGGEALARVDSLTGVDINKDIPYVLYRRHVHRDKQSSTAAGSNAGTLPIGTTPRVGRRQQFVKTTASKDPDGSMIYYMETHKITPESPHLYTSSKRVPTPPNKFRILDYVNRKSLPPEANYSYEDDSASIDSMERELFESLKQKYLQRMRQIREKSQSQESISSNESGGSSTSADSYDTVSLEELTNMRNLSQIFDQVYASGNESAAFSSTTSINTVESMRSLPQWDPQTEAEIQHMAGVISTAFQHADEDADDRSEQADVMVLDPPNGFSDRGDTLKSSKHRRESYELAISESRSGDGRPSLTGSETSSYLLRQGPPVPPKPPKLTVAAKFAQYSQSIRDSSFDLSDMDLRVFDERSYSDIQQTIRETCNVGLDRVTSSENMSSASEEPPRDMPEINVKKVMRQMTRTANVHTETSSTSSNNSTIGETDRRRRDPDVVVIHDLPSPSQLAATPLDLSDLTDIPDVPEEFRDTVVGPAVAVPISGVMAAEPVERAEPPEYQAWKAQMKELEQLTGAKSSNEPSPVTPSSSHRGGTTLQTQPSTGSGSGGYRGFTRRTPIGSTWLYRATSSDPDWEDSETSGASDTQQQPMPSTSRGRARSKQLPTSSTTSPPSKS
ncbi:FERM, RhoGEF and pleckstrin domain-containing protein 1 [Hypsibius exemplaris]|uniref:FERM, RhoGEF and pleckstrin domain-containing protein 1 n=1 Tax=Hypsibius exemplaris TaxID=2072580 RepID=A0A1W0X9F4_HYPEX|nr:FERM, RhoGEF and pleckstrin domain-containing protein 1 [Hypsibius exemplaris]